MTFFRIKGTLVLALLGGFLSITPALGRIDDASIVDDNRDMFFVSTGFGFGPDGRIDIEVKNFEFKSTKEVDFFKLGFFIVLTESQEELFSDLTQGTCALDANGAVTLLNFFDVVKNDERGEPTIKKFPLAELVPDYKGGQYTLFFVNCLAEDVSVSFNLHVAMYNMRPDGVTKDYLSVGEDMLPTVFMVGFVLFTVAANVWAVLVVRAGKDAHRLHWLMLVLIVFKAATLLSQAGMYHLIRLTGQPEGWNVAFYIFTFMRGILFFVVVVLVGTGWAYMKPLLAPREKKILMVVIPLQVLAEVAIVIMDENTPASRNWFTWRDVVHVVDIICCCAILLPIVWSIRHLREASETDGKAARSLAKLQLFRQFYVMVVIYIYFTRIVVFLLRSTMPYHYVWLSDAADLAATLAFYFFTGSKFRPAAGNPYLALDDDDYVERELVLQEEFDRGLP
eukprot:jgi/Botrbrau1/2079/Bobra.0047s0041.1